ncbi:hypothetical protein MUN89_12275 [Halobacillus salinarum]|uniref:Uncharacterized protein n=1 Tax=Halobacillus salinarum TaxID=2932257 RepID=A0ABY4EKY6_9BACI|nr:hypothetical protein [Halobacillus salinarum]UOQ42746.1 hypothetical protein MUN89_12275 [Halobacillus salinarum]
MAKSPVVNSAEFEEQLIRLREKFSLLERSLSLKADEIVFTMAVSHRKEIDQLKEEVIHLQEQLKKVKQDQKSSYIKKVSQLAKNRSVV